MDGEFIRILFSVCAMNEFVSARGGRVGESERLSSGGCHFDILLFFVVTFPRVFWCWVQA